MDVTITEEAIDKLAHHCEEIRWRMLEQIESKFMRALNNQLALVFKPSELCKQLIRWFTYETTTKTYIKVLNLMFWVFKSPYGEEAIELLGITSLKAEVCNLKILLHKRFEELDIIEKICDILDEYENRTSFNRFSDYIHKSQSCDPQNHSSLEFSALLAEDYEIVWSKNTEADYNSLKVVADMLSNIDSSSEERVSALQHLQIVMSDYPPEYMLQPPYIFSKLIFLCGRSNEDALLQTNVIASLHSFLKVLKDGLRKRVTVHNYTLNRTNIYSTMQNCTDDGAKTQIKVLKAMEMLLEKCFDILEIPKMCISKVILLGMETIREILEIMKLQRVCISSRFLKRADQLNNMFKKSFNEDLSLARPKQIWITFILLEMTEINAKNSQPADKYNFFVPQLLDYSLYIYYPNLFDRIKKISFSGDVAVEQAYEKILVLKNQIERAIKLLTQIPSEAYHVIEECSNVIPIFDVLKSLKLTKIAVGAIIKAAPLYLVDDKLKTKATSLLHNLVQLETSNLKLIVYQNIATTIQKYFGALMNNEEIFEGIQNKRLLSALIMGIPFDTNMLQHVVNESYESKSIDVKKYAQNIILLVLRSHHFYETDLKPFEQVISALLPILQCCTQLKTIYDLLLKLLDPDSKIFSFINSLRGNILFMFSNDRVVRNEALARLVYILSLLSPPTIKVSDVIGVTNKLPNDLFILQTPRELRQMFDFYESSNYTRTYLRNLLALLDITDLESKVRKSTLRQLNFMFKNLKAIKDFCEEQAHCLILSELERALTKESFTDYPENLITTISILAKLLIYDSTFRHELAKIPNMYILLLRAVFNFPTEEQLRQDTSVCIFLLAFDSLIVFSPIICHVAVPEVTKNLRVPLKCKFISTSESLEISNAIPDMQVFCSSDIEWKAYVRQVIAHSFSKAENFELNNKEYMHVKLDICPSLMINHYDTEYRIATNFFQNIDSVIMSLPNASNQILFLNLVNSLRLQLILFCQENLNLSELPVEFCNAICPLLSHHLETVPKRRVEFEVFSCVLDMLHLCVSNTAVPVIRQVKSIVLTDPHHSIVRMLKNSDLPLDIYFNINKFLAALINAYPNDFTSATLVFRRHFFQYLHEITIAFFGSRHLHQIRCLLKLSRSLTALKIGLSETTLYKCSKSFIKVLISIGSKTHTGAEIHRDCLLIFIQIFNQMPDKLKFNIPEKFLKHIIGLCGHNVVEVRALAWICLNAVSFIKLRNLLQFERQCVRGSQLIHTKLDFLPGGVIGCCLCTLLDVHEKVIVRNLAGNLFIQILNGTRNFNNVKHLLEIHGFFSSAYNSLESYPLEMVVSPHTSFLKIPSVHVEEANDHEIVTCETVICYCRICITLIKIQNEFVKEICEKPLIVKLYELMKKPFSPTDIRHNEMCAQVCHLLARCSKDNFLFLKRTVCCDERWLESLFGLLVPQKKVTKEVTICVLQLTLVLLRDDIVFRKFCEWLLKIGDSFHKFISRVLNVTNIDSTLQRCLLALVIYLLIKTQCGETATVDKINFSCFLEKEYGISQNILNSYQSVNSNALAKSLKGTFFNAHFCKTDILKITESNNEEIFDDGRRISLSELTLHSLYKIFLHLYPCKSHNFYNPPSAVKIQICETLSILLKVSPGARLAAYYSNVLSTILLILENFFREFKNEDVHFINRLGEMTKMTIAKNYILFFQILLHWFSPSSGVLVDEFECIAVCKVILQSWCWFEHSFELKLLVIKVCSFLSESSLNVCVKFSTMISGYSSSILQVVTKLVVTESYKIRKKTTSNMSVVATGLRVMMNCSACPEGRFTLLKQNALEIIDAFQPFSLKTLQEHTKLWHHWLEFWELFSRYNEGGNARNLNALCKAIIETSPSSKTRLLCLKILRNLCFFQQNRSMLTTSSCFRYTLDDVITHSVKIVHNTVLFEEELIVCVAIWQLISGGIKFMTLFRDEKITHKFRTLRQNLKVLRHGDSIQFEKIPFAVALLNVVEIILNIFGQS